MLQERSFHHFWQTIPVYWNSGPQDDVIKRMMAWSVRMQKESMRLVHRTVCSVKRSLQPSIDKTHTSKQSRKREIAPGLCSERDHWGKKARRWWRCSDYAGTRRFNESWIWGIDNQVAQIRDLTRWWLLFETVRVILPVPVMWKKGMIMMKKRQSRVR